MAIALKLMKLNRTLLYNPVILLTILTPFTAYSQKTEITLIDSVHNEPVAFAAIVNASNQIIATSSIEGKAFISPGEGEKITIKCTGYKNYSYRFSSNITTIYLQPDTYFLNDITVLSGPNPAHRLIDLAVKNRDKNNPEKNVRFSYNAYNKLVFTTNQDSLEKESKNHPLSDSSFHKMKNFFDTQHLFITESVTEKNNIPPSKSSEKIIANRVSGFQNPLFSILATEFQSFGYYKDEIKLMGISHLNPISNNSYSHYKFRLTDTSFDGKDTLFTITFEPKSGKSFKGLQGSLVIHTDSYALKSIKARPVRFDGFNIYINQLYEKIENRQWFPVQLNARIVMPENVSFSGLNLYGENKGLITNIKFLDESKKVKTDEIELEITSATKDSSINRLKPFSQLLYDEKDEPTYKVIDSLGKEAKFDKKFGNLTQIMTGKIPIGPVSADLKHLFNYNHYEGYRLGMGLVTNHKVSKRHHIGGYVAYGFKDKAIKYGGDLRILFYPRKQTELTVNYKNDLFEAAGPVDYMEPFTFLSPVSLRKLYLRKFDKQEIWQAMIGSRLLKHFHLKSFLNYQLRNPLYDYEYQTPSTSNIYFSPSNYEISEIGGIVRFAFREKFILADNNLISKGTNWPVIHFKYTQSFNQFVENSYDFHRFDIKMDKSIKIRKFGTFAMQIHYGKINGNVPYSYLNSFIASMEKFVLSVPNTFETMRVNEFLSDEYAMIFLSHNFLSNLFYNTKSQPQLELFSSFGWGRLNNVQGSHVNMNYTVPEKGYFESGLRIHSLIKSQFSRFGICLAYRYGPYANEKLSDNFVIKFTTGIVLD